MRTTPSPRRAVEIVDLERSRAAEAAWRALGERLGPRSALTSFDTVAAYLARFGRDLRPRFALLDGGNGGIGGVALLTRGDIMPGVPAVHLGLSGEPRAEAVATVNRLLAVPHERDRFARELVAAIAADCHRPVLVLPRFHPGDAQALERAVAAAGLKAVEKRLPCPTFDLRRAAAQDRPTSVERVLSLLGQKTRRNIASHRRRLEGVHGEHRPELATTPAQIQPIFDELIELHRTQWREKGAPGFLGSERLISFIRDLIASGHTIAFREKYGDTTVGCLLLLIDGDQVVGYKSGLNMLGSSIGSANVTHASFMAALLDRGEPNATYSLGPGEPYGAELGRPSYSDYKRHLATDPAAHVVSTYAYEPTSLRGWVFKAAWDARGACPAVKGALRSRLAAGRRRLRLAVGTPPSAP